MKENSLKAKWQRWKSSPEARSIRAYTLICLWLLYAILINCLWVYHSGLAEAVAVISDIVLIGLGFDLGLYLSRHKDDLNTKHNSQHFETDGQVEHVTIKQQGLVDPNQELPDDRLILGNQFDTSKFQPPSIID